MNDQPLSSAPDGYRTVNPFVIPKGATEFILFLERVFQAHEDLEARTPDSDGLLIHAEVRIGDSVLMIADSKPDWPLTPSYLQVYVKDGAAVVERARSAGATVITELSDLVYGERIARFRDPWENLWWIFEPASAEPTSQPDRPEEYVYETIVAEMRRRAESVG